MDRIDEAIARLLDGGGPIPELPPRVLKALGPGPAEPDGLARVLAVALRHYPPEPEELDALDLRGAIRLAESNLLYAFARAHRDAANPLIRDREAVLSEARAATPAWDWVERGPRRWIAGVALGRMRLKVEFWRAGPEGEWHHAWGGDETTNRFLDHLDDLGRQGTPVRTGLFPAIDRVLGQAIAAFVEGAAPATLCVDGLDGRRNAHNLATYGAHAGPGYAVVPVRAPHTVRATADGVTGIRIVRLSDPVPAP